MQIGDLVRHRVHTGALGIIVETNKVASTTKIHWLNNSWGVEWTDDHQFEVINET